MSKLEIYSKGLVCCSVCHLATMTTREIEDDVNRLNPTGVDSRWKISRDKTFKGGNTNPCVCEQSSERMHRLLVC